MQITIGSWVREQEIKSHRAVMEMIYEEAELDECGVDGEEVDREIEQHEDVLQWIETFWG
jgi:hypothetical protein